MSVAALVLVKDEEDIIEDVVCHLAYHVDEIIVRDNMSTDGTLEKLQVLKESFTDMLDVATDEEIGYWQSRKMTQLAQYALSKGHTWVVPCDADECWYVGADIERRIADYLAGLAPDVHIVRASLYNHIPTSRDDERLQPFKRIGWRKRERAPLHKVACRLHPSLVIEAGNHAARYAGAALASDGLVVRHFSWRTPEQYVRKIVNGLAAYAATDLPDSLGIHWRMWEGSSKEEIVNHFRTWFYSYRPEEDDSLIYDPAPWRCKK